MTRRWLVVISGVAHLAIAGGFWVSGIWHIERLEAPRLTLRGLGVMVPPPPAGQPTPGEPPKPDPVKTRIVKGPVQPNKRRPEPPRPETEIKREGEPHESDTESDIDIGSCLDCPPAPVAEVKPVCGDRLRDASEQCDDGNTVNGDGCSSACLTEVKPVVTAMVSQAVLQGLRTSGETQIHPSPATQQMMIRDGAWPVRAALRVCIATDGRVASVAMSVSTRYPDYDADLLAAVHSWRYRPYTVNGAPVPACSMVTFTYNIR